MNNRTVVYRASRSVLDGSIRTRTIANNEPLPKGCYWTEEEAKEVLNEVLKKQAEEYEKYKPYAMLRLNSTEKRIKELLEKSNCELAFTYEGDTHGICDEMITISTTVNGRDYTKEVIF